MIELTKTLKHSSAVATERHKKREAELIEHGFLAPPPPKKELAGVRDSVTSSSSVVSTGARAVGVAGNATKGALSEDEEAVRQRLEAMGAIVGANLAER